MTKSLTLILWAGGALFSGLLASLFIDVSAYVAMACALAALDVITGVFAARKRGEKITGKRLMDSIKKSVWYCLAIVLTHQVELLVFQGSPIALIRKIPLSYTVSSYIVLKEFLSNIENIQELTGVKLSTPVKRITSFFFFITNQKTK